jgi:outer membrane cobalamin receptor
LPGIYVRYGADGVPRIDVRGLRTRNVLLLQDGVPLNSGFDGQFDPASIPANNIAEVKVTRGANSVLYGPGGNAGVIEIVTRSAGDALRGDVAGEYEFDEAYELRGSLSGRTGNVGLSFWGSAFDRDHFELSDDFRPTELQPDDERANSDREQSMLQGNAVFDAGGTRLGFSLSYRDGEYGKPPTTVDNTESPYANRARFERVDFDALSVQAAAEFGRGEPYSLRPTLYFNRDNELTNGYDDADFDSQVRNGAFRDDATTEVLGLGALGSLRLAAGQLLSASVTARQENWEASGFTVTRTGTRPIAQDESVDVYSLDVEGEFEVGRAAGIVAGLGYSQQSRADGKDDDGVSWLVGADYRLTEATTLRASAARKLRYPTLRDLYAADRGNPELSAETTYTVDLAARHQFATNGLAVEAVLFRIDAEDFIERVPDGITQNFERYRFTGVELTADYRPFERFGLAASYTYIESENRSSGADTETLQNRPEHKLSLRVDYAFTPAIRVGGNYVYSADSYTLSNTTPTTTQELGDYGVLDLDASFELMQGRVRAYGRVHDAFDEDYQDSLGFPQPGRTWVLGAELRL